MAEAFGPYTSHNLQPMPEPRRRIWQDIALVIAGILAVVVIFTIGA
jgi:hypothetical protein